MALTNPFFHRGPIRDRSYFVGRKRELEQALSLLGNGQCVALVGQRRIGKTSLLFHLADPEIMAQYQLNPAEHLFVYIDCGGLAGLDPSGLYRVLLEEISDVLADKVTSLQTLEMPDSTQPITYRAFERTMRALTRQGWKPIILLDEFERMSLNPQLDPDFFSGLRALTARYPLAYVTASKRPLLELTYADASILSSPFFNIFASIRLRLLSEEEAHDLLTGLAARAQVSFASPTLDFILELAGPHPLFLQIAGFHAFDMRQAKGAALTPTDYPKLEARFRASAQEHLDYYWRNLPETEQHVLATLPAAQNSHPESLRRLEQECLILRRGERYDYLSIALRAFVQTQSVASLLQAGPIAIETDRHQALLHGQPLDLTPTQYTLLVHLIERAGQVITTEALEQAVWGDEYIEDPERLKSVIKGLRQALGTEANRLENVRGVGYRFSP
jgi:hypothetical protein